MAGRIHRFTIFAGFVVAAILLFFLARSIAGIFYAPYKNSSILEQFSGVYSVSIVYIGLYVLLLIALAVTGLIVSNQRKNQETKMGFLYSLLFSLVLTIAYLKLFFF